MKRISLILPVCLLGVVAHAQLIDDFSGSLAAYTNTKILDANGGAANTYAWEISGGSLQINTSVYDGIEQSALTRNDYPLAVGSELIASYSALNTGSQDIGLYVGAGTPVAGVRADYVNIYARNNGQVFSRGFNGTTEFSLAGGGTPTLDTLFIARTGTDTFDLGYYSGAIRTILTTRTVANTAIGNTIGVYSDVRAAGIRGNLDNLAIQVIPEPTAATLLGLGALGAILRFRRK